MALRLEVPQETTFASTATQTLEGLWAAVHRSVCPPEVRSSLSSMMLPWGSAAIPDRPSWHSDIGDDHSPFEFSLALAPEAAEIRLLVEAQGSSGTFASTREAGLRLNDRLAQRGADLRRFNQVRDLFLPDVRDARFAIWHAVTLARGRLHAKAYLNPQIAGVDRAVAIVRDALRRLDMQASWSAVVSAIPRRALRGDAVRYFALDLEHSAAARVKLYLYLPDSTTRTLEGVAALRDEYVAGEVTEFCRAMTGTSGPYDARPICVYIAFTGRETRPSSVTVQVPIRYYVSNDRVARARIQSYLEARGLDADRYHRALGVVAQRPLHAQSGLHSYVSLRTGLAVPRVTLYFAAELYGSHMPLSGTQRLPLRRDVDRVCRLNEDSGLQNVRRKPA